MRKEWFPSKKLFGGFRCIENRHTGELCLYGKNGEIWEFSENNEPRYSCSVWGQYGPNRMAALLQAKRHEAVEKGSETLFRFNSDLLPKVVGILCVPKTRPVQIRLLEKRRFPDAR